MADSAHLRIERRGAVAWVTLNRPTIHNAFDDTLIASLTTAADDLGRDESVRAVVLAGEGKSFCAGADLNWMRRMVDWSVEDNRTDSEALARMYEAWDTLPHPVIGRIHGAALGGGVGLVAVCDIAVASDRAKFGLTEVRLGILPAVISPFVVARMGAGACRELFLTGERIDAARACALGLVHRVVSEENLDREIDAVTTMLLEGGPHAQARAKKLLTEIAGLSPEAARPLTTTAIAEARVGDEGQEGMRAFLERRPAAWRKES